MIAGSPRSFIASESLTVVTISFEGIARSLAPESGRGRDVASVWIQRQPLYHRSEGVLERAEEKFAAALYQFAVVERNASAVGGGD